MPKKERPSQERLKELFQYDAYTGLFTRNKPSRVGPIGRKYGRSGAGRISELGYVLVMVDGINYIAGSLAWQYVHGVWPARVKYIDGNPLNNRIDNIGTYDKSAEEIQATDLTIERLKELLHYEPSTGWFTWRTHSSVTRPGERAGCGHGLGYRQIGVDYKKYLEHILAYFYMTGEWPQVDIDHDNRIKSDNRWENLKLATRSQNNRNRGMSARNKLGFPGVMRHGNKYRARIDVDSGPIDLGCFHTIAQARICRLLAEKEHFGKFTTYDEDRDGALPLGDKYISTVMRNNRLFVFTDQGNPVEVKSVTELIVFPVTSEGNVIQ